MPGTNYTSTYTTWHRSCLLRERISGKLESGAEKEEAGEEEELERRKEKEEEEGEEELEGGEERRRKRGGLTGHLLWSCSGASCAGRARPFALPPPCAQAGRSSGSGSP